MRPSDTLKIWREGSLYTKWFPLATNGKVLKERHPAEVVLHLEFNQV